MGSLWSWWPFEAGIGCFDAGRRRLGGRGHFGQSRQEFGGSPTTASDPAGYRSWSFVSVWPCSECDARIRHPGFTLVTHCRLRGCPGTRRSGVGARNTDRGVLTGGVGSLLDDRRASQLPRGCGMGTRRRSSVRQPPPESCFSFVPVGPLRERSGHRGAPEVTPGRGTPENTESAGAKSVVA